MKYLSNRRLMTKHVSLVDLHLLIVSLSLSGMLHTTVKPLSLYNSFPWAAKGRPLTLIRYADRHSRCTWTCLRQRKSSLHELKAFSYAANIFCTMLLGCKMKKAY